MRLLENSYEIYLNELIITEEMNKNELINLKLSAAEILTKIIPGIEAAARTMTPLNFRTKIANIRALLDLYLQHLLKIEKKHEAGSPQAVNLRGECYQLQELIDKLKFIKLTEINDVKIRLTLLCSKIKIELQIVQRGVEEELKVA